MMGGLYVTVQLIATFSSSVILSGVWYTAGEMILLIVVEMYCWMTGRRHSIGDSNEH